MPAKGRTFVRVVKFLLAGVTIFCFSWIASVNEWHTGVRLTNRRGYPERSMSTMRTIVGYSEKKQEEMNRPTTVSCDRLPVFPKIKHFISTLIYYFYSQGEGTTLKKPIWTKLSIVVVFHVDILPVYLHFRPIPNTSGEILTQSLPSTLYIVKNRTWSHNSDTQTWQRVAGTHVSLYSAYYDERLPQRYVRILATFPGRNFSSQYTLFCQTRSSNPHSDSVEVVAAKPLEIWYHTWDLESLKIETPLLLSCPLTETLHGPSVVSVVMQPCDDPTNAIELIPSKNYKAKRTFTICVKDMEFHKDISQNLIEWIEINKILGVDMIDVYVNKVTKASEKVLLHYQDQGYVRLFNVPIKGNSNRSLWQRRRDHAITYNDCLYRNLEQSEFIVPLDVDEVILPKIVDTWPELLIRLQRLGWNTSHYSSILIKNVFFFDFMQDVSKYKSIKSQGIKDDTYDKRDDVRIKVSPNLEIGDIKLVYDSNSNIDTINNDINEEDEVLNAKYKSRCRRKLPTPKLVSYVVSSAKISPFGMYSKSWMSTKKVLTAFNHYPLSSIGPVQSPLGWSSPVKEVQLNHYKESCNTTVFEECAQYGRRARIDTAALRLSRRLTRAIAQAICIPINSI